MKIKKFVKIVLSLSVLILVKSSMVLCENHSTMLLKPVAANPAVTAITFSVLKFDSPYDLGYTTEIKYKAVELCLELIVNDGNNCCQVTFNETGSEVTEPAEVVQCPARYTTASKEPTGTVSVRDRSVASSRSYDDQRD